MSNNSTLELESIYNDYTINIFSDASVTRNIGAYGSIAVCRDYELERSIFTACDTTVNISELSGIKLSLLMAYKYQYRYKVINIFSDSKLSIDIIKGFSTHNYKAIGENEYEITRLVKNKYIPYSNQIYIADCIYLYYTLLQNPNIIVNIIHQPAHLIPNNFNNLGSIKKGDIDDCRYKFAINNSIDAIPSTEFIFYISKYNDLIDRSTRIALNEMQLRTEKLYYTSPLHFKPLCCINKNLIREEKKN